jgi:TolB protein
MEPHRLHTRVRVVARTAAPTSVRRVVLLAMLTAVAIAIPIGRAQVATNAPSGLIAFVDLDGGLALLDPQTLATTTVGAAGSRSAFPVWSSDGNRLAVIVADQAGVRVDVVDVANGSAVETVHREPGRSPIYLGWAPDDRLLAVLVGIPGGGLALDLVPTGGTAMGDLQAVRTLTEGAPFYWSWARTGRSLFVHVDVGSSRALAGITSVAAFEVREPLPEPIGFQSPALSSDDRFLAYARREPVGRSVVVRPNPDRPGGAFEPIVVPFRGTAALAWRPGRAQLAVQRSSEPSPHPYGPIDLVDAATGDVRRLTDDVVIASFWSPDGRYLATLSLVGGGGERTIQATGDPGRRVALPVQAQRTAFSLKVIDVDGGTVRPLGVFTPSPTFLLQYLPFFDQYARSHRLWSPASDALVVPALDDDGVPTLVWFGVDGDVRPLVPGDLPAWNVR